MFRNNYKLEFMVKKEFNIYMCTNMDRLAWQKTQQYLTAVLMPTL